LYNVHPIRYLRRRNFIINLKNNATIPSDIWSVGKAPIAMFEFTTWLASFPDSKTSDTIALFENNNCLQITETEFAEYSFRPLTG
jgi:hypothetical protein